MQWVGLVQMGKDSLFGVGTIKELPPAFRAIHRTSMIFRTHVKTAWFV